MADQTPNPNSAAPAAGAPPAEGAPPASAAAPAGGAPPPAAAAPTVPAAGKKNKPAVINIPANEFKRRVRRDAEQVLREELGISLEEAKKILGKGGTPPAPAASAAPASGTPSSPAASAAPAADPEKERLRLENAQLQADKLDLEKRNKKIARREADKVMHLKLTNKALQAGVKDEETGYVLDLYARAVRANPEGQTPPDPVKFFEELRPKRPHLFVGATPPPPVTLSPTTAPPESRQPGGEIPNPKPPGDPPKRKTVEEMNDAEFKTHTASTYGYTPGAA